MDVSTKTTEPIDVDLTEDEDDEMQSVETPPKSKGTLPNVDKCAEDKTTEPKSEILSVPPLVGLIDEDDQMSGSVSDSKGKSKPEELAKKVPQTTLKESEPKSSELTAAKDKDDDDVELEDFHTPNTSPESEKSVDLGLGIDIEKSSDIDLQFKESPENNNIDQCPTKLGGKEQDDTQSDTDINKVISQLEEIQTRNASPSAVAESVGKTIMDIISPVDQSEKFDDIDALLASIADSTDLDIPSPSTSAGIPGDLIIVSASTENQPAQESNEIIDSPESVQTLSAKKQRTDVSASDNPLTSTKQESNGKEIIDDDPGNSLTPPEENPDKSNEKVILKEGENEREMDVVDDSSSLTENPLTTTDQKPEKLNEKDVQIKVSDGAGDPSKEKPEINSNTKEFQKEVNDVSDNPIVPSEGKPKASNAKEIKIEVNSCSASKSPVTFTADTPKESNAKEIKKEVNEDSSEKSMEKAEVALKVEPDDSGIKKESKEPDVDMSVKDADHMKEEDEIDINDDKMDIKEDEIKMKKENETDTGEGIENDDNKKEPKKSDESFDVRLDEDDPLAILTPIFDSSNNQEAVDPLFIADEYDDDDPLKPTTTDLEMEVDEMADKPSEITPTEVPSKLIDSKTKNVPKMPAENEILKNILKKDVVDDDIVMLISDSEDEDDKQVLPAKENQKVESSLPDSKENVKISTDPPKDANEMKKEEPSNGPAELEKKEEAKNEAKQSDAKPKSEETAAEKSESSKKDNDEDDVIMLDEDDASSKSTEKDKKDEATNKDVPQSDAIQKSSVQETTEKTPENKTAEPKPETQKPESVPKPSTSAAATVDDDDVIMLDEDDDISTKPSNQTSNKKDTAAYDASIEAVVTASRQKTPIRDSDLASTSTVQQILSEEMELLNKDSSQNSTASAPAQLPSTPGKGGALPKATPPRECINFECTSKRHVEFTRAPNFVLSYFNVPRKISKSQFVCTPCFDRAAQSYRDLTGALVDEQPLLLQILPKRTDLVEILDSSDEDDNANDDNEANECMSSEIRQMLEQDLDDLIQETLEKVNINQQMNWTKSILDQKLQQNEDSLCDIEKDLKSLQKMADTMYSKLYRNSNFVIEELPPFDLNTNKQMQLAGPYYPPYGEIERPEPDTVSLYYSVRQKMLAAWIPCKVMEPMDGTTQGQTRKCYKVKFLRSKGMLIKCVPENHIAYGSPPNLRLKVGERVIALFQMENQTNSNKENSRALFFPGIIAEPLQAYNRWRYLIFFDDGYAQYVTPDNVRVIVGVSDKVWEDVHPDSATFIENYLTQYKTQRPMVQVRKGQRMITEWNSKWLYAKVNEIDSSLVQMYFEEGKRLEWIYRGSTRLGILFRERQQQSQQKHSAGMNKRNEPYVEYISLVDDDVRVNKTPIVSPKPVHKATPPPPTPPPPPPPPLQRVPSQSSIHPAPAPPKATPEKQPISPAHHKEQHTEQPEEKRAVAKKSVSAPQKPQVQHMNNSTIYVDEDNRPKGKVVYYTAKKHMPPRKYVPHSCYPGCLYEVKHNLSSYSPLAKPLLSGWERQICKSKTKKVVTYRAPCGRRLRNMAELHQYLRMTNCPLNVENFDFDYLIHCLAEYVIDSCIMQNSDISGAIEQMVVPCVNYYDNTTPPPCSYSAKRIPTEGVNLNLEKGFLCGCDCEDDCLDKMKCQCWQLTLAGAKFGNPNTPPENVGYEYKRLPDPVPTGIYECNSRCKCSRTCLNRVAQQPLQMKLQVFKTGNRGWGLRCLNDVPKGSFICIYAGDLLTEQNANEAGDNYGDEYFAELDYIEVVENLKEGYEPDVTNDDDFDDDEYDPSKNRRTAEDSEDEEFVARSVGPTDRQTRYNTRNSDASKSKSKETMKKDPKTKSVPGTNGGMKSETAVGSGEKSHPRIDQATGEIILSDEDEERQPISFVPNPNTSTFDRDQPTKYRSVRKFFGKNENVYIMDAKKTGNIGRYFNHSCSPNLFVQNVFVDTHDLRFPWVAFFASTHIRAGTELTWNYNYDVGSVPGKVLYCQCGSESCRGRLL